MARLLALRTFIAVLKRAIALSDRLKPATWKCLAITLTILTAVSFWGYLNVRQRHVLITDHSSSGSSYKSHEGQGIHTPVIAAARGKVRVARAGKSYRHFAYIVRGNRPSTRYHLARMAAAYRQRIMRGEVLGHADSITSSTKPHMHFGVLRKYSVITGYSLVTKSPANQPFGGTIEGTGFVSGTQVCINTTCDPAPSAVVLNYSGHGFFSPGGDLRGWHKKALSDSFGSTHTSADTLRALVLETTGGMDIPVIGQAEVMAAASYTSSISPYSLSSLESHFSSMSNVPPDIETAARSDATSLITEVSRLCAAVREVPRTTEAGPTVVMVVMPSPPEPKQTPANLPLWAVFAAFIFNGVSAVLAWISILISYQRGKTDQLLKAAQIAKLQIEIAQLHKQLERDARETPLRSAMPWF